MTPSSRPRHLPPCASGDSFPLPGDPAPVTRLFGPDPRGAPPASNRPALLSKAAGATECNILISYIVILQAAKSRQAALQLHRFLAQKITMQANCSELYGNQIARYDGQFSCVCISINIYIVPGRQYLHSNLELHATLVIPTRFFTTRLL